MDTKKFQVEIMWKEGTTDKQKDAIAPFIQETINAAEDAEGTESAIPACVDALTLRRTQE